MKYYILLLASAVCAASSQSHAVGCTAEDAEDLASFLQVDLHAKSDTSFERELAEQRRTLDRELAEQNLDAHSDRTFERELGERRTYERELGEQLAQQQALEDAVESASIVPLERTSRSSQLQHQSAHGHSAAESQTSEGRALLGDTTEIRAEPLRAKGSHKGESLLGVTAQVTQSREDTNALGQGRGVTTALGQGREDTTALVSRLSHAVEAQSKAMMMLESEVEVINAREIALERAEAAKEACSDYSKQGYGPITDKDSCKSACEKAEGLQGGSFRSDTSSCSCKVNNSNYRTICGTSGLSLSLLATLGMLFMFFRD